MAIPDHVNPRPQVTRGKAKPRLVESLPDVTDAEIDEALAAINPDQVYDELRSAWTVETWDRVSPINGVPAEHFLNRGDVPEQGDVYLLLHEGKVVGFQPHEPDQPGHTAMPTGTGQARGVRHADRIAVSGVENAVIAKARARIVSRRGA